MSTKHSDLIPNFIKAPNPQGLRAAMFRNNAKLGAECQYFDIQTYKEGERTVWIAWFYERLEGIDDLTS